MLICEDIQAFNWARAADYGGKVSTLSCFLTGVLSLFMGMNVGIGLYTVFIGFLLASIELPFIYVCIPACSKFRSVATESVFLTNGFLRMGVYVLLSILMFTHKTLNIMTGIFIVLTALFYLVGWAVGKYEEQEQAKGTSYNPVPGERVPITGAGFQQPAAAAANPSAQQSSSYNF
ncbi:hypothetical protein TrST_g398 [Triparma strigata]|uniref:Golgi apparatus membrane protein TVP18 n=1 Tax=Triparma strigata TaxID=1606541 RepID=A0A9W7EV55_9STRA|nr:hypothetical protein TrST_g398 [Triparma strigata]